MLLGGRRDSENHFSSVRQIPTNIAEIGKNLGITKLNSTIPSIGEKVKSASNCVLLEIWRRKESPTMIRCMVLG